MVKGVAKKMTLIILALSFLGGLIGSFIESFDMLSYINFLKAFALYFGGMIASIGANSAISKLQSKKVESNDNKESV